MKPSMKHVLEDIAEHDYLTHIVFKLYENVKIPVNSVNRFRLELYYSPGCQTDYESSLGSIPLPAEAVCLNDNLTLHHVLDLFTRAYVDGFSCPPDSPLAFFEPELPPHLSPRHKAKSGERPREVYVNHRISSGGKAHTMRLTCF